MLTVLRSDLPTGSDPAAPASGGNEGTDGEVRCFEVGL
jgi:hypothetical protein